MGGGTGAGMGTLLISKVGVLVLGCACGVAVEKALFSSFFLL